MNNQSGTPNQHAGQDAEESKHPGDHQRCSSSPTQNAMPSPKQQRISRNSAITDETSIGGARPPGARTRSLAVGANEYFGLFDEAGGLTDDRDALGPVLDEFRAYHPRQDLMVTEFGSDGNRSGRVEEYGTYQFQTEMLGYHLGVFATNSWLSGAILQALQDFTAFPTYNRRELVAQRPVQREGAPRRAWKRKARLHARLEHLLRNPTDHPATRRLTYRQRGSAIYPPPFI
jgi:hypothetical protein